MKRFLLFMGEDYYPSGGWSDFIAAFDTLEDAREAANRLGQYEIWLGWGHVAELTERGGKDVWTWTRQPKPSEEWPGWPDE